MSTVAESSSWRGLFGCLGVGSLVVVGVVLLVLQLHRSEEQKLTRIDREFLQPWVEAVREGQMETAWSNLTTDSYREAFPRDSVEATYRNAVLRFGPPVRVTLHGQIGTKTPGSPYLSRTATEWEWQKGETLHLIFHLADIPDQGYRVERANVGTLSKTATGYHPPEGTPEGPW